MVAMVRSTGRRCTSTEFQAQSTLVKNRPQGGTVLIECSPHRRHIQRRRHGGAVQRRRKNACGNMHGWGRKECKSRQDGGGERMACNALTTKTLVVCGARSRRKPTQGGNWMGEGVREISRGTGCEWSEVQCESGAWGTRTELWRTADRTRQGS